jgi:hypothetical protein
MAVPDAHLLFAVRRADARIHIEHDAPWRATAVNFIDPLAGQISERRKVLCGREPARLEATHLARRCRCTSRRLAANDPAHRRITTKAFSVVYVLISRETSEQGLAKHSNQSMSTVLPRARIGKALARNCTQAEGVVEFPVGNQAGIGSHHRSAKLFNRRSKSSLRTPSSESPAGFAMTASFKSS